MEYPNDKSNKLRYVVYIRKSTEEKERQVLSLDAQLKSIKEKFPKLNIVAVLSESKSAFKPFNRDVFNEALRMIQNGEADALIAWHPNRLSRNEIDAGNISYQLRMGVIKDLKFVDYYFINTPDGLKNLQHTMSDSQYSSASLSMVVKRGNKEKRETGGISGLAMQGYVNFTNAAGERHIKPDKHRWPILREAVDMMLTGEYTVPSLLYWLNNERGYRTIRRRKVGGGPLSRAALYSILKNVRYTGWIEETYNREQLYKANYTPLLTTDEYDRIQALLGRKGGKRFATRQQFALRGLVRCGECGCSITAQRQDKLLANGMTNQHVYYHCTHKKGYCSQKAYVKEESLYAMCEDLLEQYELSPELYEWSMEAMKEMLSEEAPKRHEASDMLTKAIKSTELQLDRLLDSYTRGIIEDDDFVPKSKQLKDELKQLHVRVQEHSETTDDWYEFMSTTFLKLIGITEGFKSGDFAYKKDILLAIGQNPILLNGKLEITPNKWLLPVKEGLQRLNSQFEEVRTMDLQMKKDLLKVLRLDWCG